MIMVVTGIIIVMVIQMMVLIVTVIVIVGVLVVEMLILIVIITVTLMQKPPFATDGQATMQCLLKGLWQEQCPPMLSMS